MAVRRPLLRPVLVDSPLVFLSRDPEGLRLRKAPPIKELVPPTVGAPTGPPQDLGLATVTPHENGYVFANPHDEPVSIVWHGRDIYLPPRSEVAAQFDTSEA